MTIIQTRPVSRLYLPTSRPTGVGANEWVERGANFVVAYAELSANNQLARESPDEYVIYLPDGGADVESGTEHVSCESPCVVIAPSGRSLVTMRAKGRVLRIFSSAAEDLAALAHNADVYADGAHEVAPIAAMPLTQANRRLRCYRLQDYAGRTMRLFRSANLMLNIFDRDGPRDPETLSPHAHDDFEQASFAMEGEWVHSLRYPWSKQMSRWRDDEHLQIGSPSIVVIPAAVIHTSRSVSTGHSQLVDIFSPPRRDFIDQGLVCNESEYTEPSISGEGDACGNVIASHSLSNDATDLALRAGVELAEDGGERRPIVSCAENALESGPGPNRRFERQ